MLNQKMAPYKCCGSSFLENLQDYVSISFDSMNLNFYHVEIEMKTFFSLFNKQGMNWTPSKMIARMGREINDESSVYYWAYKVYIVRWPTSHHIQCRLTYAPVIIGPRSIQRTNVILNFNIGQNTISNPFLNLKPNYN